jgi:hypothetical protein
MVGSAGLFNGGESGGIRIHAGASSAALMRDGAKLEFLENTENN